MRSRRKPRNQPAPPKRASIEELVGFFVLARGFILVVNEIGEEVRAMFEEPDAPTPQPDESPPVVDHWPARAYMPTSGPGRSQWLQAEARMRVATGEDSD